MTWTLNKGAIKYLRQNVFAAKRSVRDGEGSEDLHYGNNTK
jgi:hypothetical protein